MPILTGSGRVVMAQSIALRPIHLAWGPGDGSWTTNPPAEDIHATTVTGEYGRHVATLVGYVTPDEAGAIIIPDVGRFTVSGTPTNCLHIRTDFDFDDASSSEVRQIGLFVGTVLVGGLPGGQKYFIPAEVSDPGRLLQLENIPIIYRSSAIEESFETVIQF